MKTIKSEKLEDHIQSCPKSTKKKIGIGILAFGLLSLFWFIFRTGTKPSRITYPCQQAALRNMSYALSLLFPFIGMSLLSNNKRNLKSYAKIALIAVLIISPLAVGLYLQRNVSVEEISLSLEQTTASVEPISDIFVVNGQETAHIENLIDLMGENNLLFYQSPTSVINQGPEGLFSATDVILLKINCQWSKRGGSNTDLLKELIQALIDHPDGFTGEIIIADNGQGRGSMDWAQTNAEDQAQSAQDIADYFSSDYNVSTFLCATTPPPTTRTVFPSSSTKIG